MRTGPHPARGSVLVTHRESPRGPKVVVPDNPWSTVYDPATVRAAAHIFELGGNDDEAWRAYLDTGDPEPEAVRALRVAAKVHGRKIKTRRKRRQPTKL